MIDEEGLPSSSSSTSLPRRAPHRVLPHPPVEHPIKFVIVAEYLAIALGVSLGLLGGLVLIFLAYIFEWRHVQAARACSDGTGAGKWR